MKGRATATRADDLRRALEREILSGELAPGMRLDEQTLAIRHKVSRTPVREALRQLASSGLVEMRSRQTPIVATLTIPKLIQMFEVMAELEGLCTRLATRRMTVPQRKALLDIHKRLIAALEKNEPAKFYEINREFHHLIYEAAESEFLAEQTNQIRNRVGPYRRHVTYRPGRMAATIHEHQLVIDAILAGDAEAAGKAMRDHVNLLGENLTDFIASLPIEVTAPQKVG
ncbi:GntR family transcriptional regulator [Oceanibacterium hippocampi]|uniref:Putative HTH-type transcriptional regulator YdfH n=1 Tax=Oceanibacterium hippocampi TaxID=745714 RepID=A0A1Y5TWJ8_9PROT|nr:GntR family transcriptional regulator [Oceanibacterium hippocampi]SLN75480.1 putative HTH-type transcriptional regulator YdfH [Oceanibacterium hippocampi]